MLGKEIANGECTGCAACVSVCPTNAIKLIENENGFREPIVDQEKCINCRLCKRLCEMDIDYMDPKSVFIAKHKSETVYKNSQSGGAFTAISDYILSRGGVVYGAVFNDAFEVIHVRAVEAETRDKMRGSKYIQSDMDSVYKNIETDLRSQNLVLFVGTGCQVAGILRFLQKKRLDLSNFYAVDLLCHGVPSLVIWRDTLNYFRKKFGAEVTSICLKELQEKSRPVLSMKFGSKEVADIVYRKLYYSNLALRASCYSCQYNKTQRVGDITIGDAWGIDKANPEFNDKRGVSLILFNSDKAVQIQKYILSAMETKQVEIRDYIQECMKSSAKPNRSTATFWKDYHSRKFEFIIEKYAKNNLFLNIPYVLKRVWKMIIRS